MKELTFITGNQAKADYLAQYLELPVRHQKIDQEEIQSLHLQEIAEHKAKTAYEHVHGPVIVEDVALEFVALGRLPGTFIRWFIEELGLEGLCALVDGKERAAVARCALVYFDGVTLQAFEGSLQGSIATGPASERGFGWDSIFIPEGYRVTRASLSEADYKKTYLIIKPLAQLKAFLESIQ
jgi:inosine triphosphate pyrophosphatase